jgi:DNA-binding transcriptional LysR family regulator
MNIKNIFDLEVFIATADLNSLSATARLFDISPAVASASLKRLEADLGVVLFIRSTRSMRLTYEGNKLLDVARPLLQNLSEVELEFVNDSSLVKGHLNITMPSDLGRSVLLPWFDEFLDVHPQLTIRTQLTDRMIDIYREPIDLLIRYGTPADSDMISMPLIPDNRRVLCASEAYLKKNGIPTDPRQLVEHNCLCFNLGDNIYNHWRFSNASEQIEIKVSGDRSTDDAYAVRYWAISGYGICYRSWVDVRQDVVSGKLRVICQDWQGEKVPLNLYSPDRRQISPAVKKLRAHLELKFRAYLSST